MIRHSLLYFLVRAGTGVFAIATLAVFTRLLTPHEYGVYAIGVATATMASAILFQWLNVALGRFYPMHRENPDVIMAAAARGFWVATAAAAMLFLAALPFSQMFGMPPAQYGILFLITVMLGRHNLALQLANAQGLPLRFGLLSWARSGGTLLLGFALIYHGTGAPGALIGFMAGLVLAIVAFSPSLALKFKPGFVHTKTSLDMLRYGLPLTLNFLAMVIVDVADRFMINGLLGAEHVAPYAATYDFVQHSMGSIMNVLFLAAFPTVIQVQELEGDESARSHIRTLGSAIVGIGLPAVVGLSVLSSEISVLLFGAAFHQDAVRLMPWLALAILIGCFKSYYLDLAFQLRQLTKYQAYIAVLMAIANVMLNMLLLPRYGVIAAAWSTIAAFFIGATVSWYIGKSVFALPSLVRDSLKCACASAVMALVLVMLPSYSGIVWLLVMIACGITAYSSMAWLLNIMHCRNYLGEFTSRRALQLPDRRDA